MPLVLSSPSAFGAASALLPSSVRVRVGRRAARRLGFGCGRRAVRGAVVGRRFAVVGPPPVCPSCGLSPCSPWCRWFVPFLALVAVFALASAGAAAGAVLAFLPLSAGGAVGPFFGRAFSAFRCFVPRSRFGRPVAVPARLVGRRGVVPLFPSVCGSGLCFRPGCSFPVFLCLPSGVLVPSSSVLPFARSGARCGLPVPSSVFSPVCAGRLAAPGLRPDEQIKLWYE